MHTADQHGIQGAPDQDGDELGQWLGASHLGAVVLSPSISTDFGLYLAEGNKWTWIAWVASVGGREWALWGSVRGLLEKNKNGMVGVRDTRPMTADDRRWVVYRLGKSGVEEVGLKGALVLQRGGGFKAEPAAAMARTDGVGASDDAPPPGPGGEPTRTVLYLNEGDSWTPAVALRASTDEALLKSFVQYVELGFEDANQKKSLVAVKDFGAKPTTVISYEVTDYSVKKV